MKNFIIAALLALASIGCQSSGGDRKDAPGRFDGTFTAEATRTYSDSNGTEENNVWNAWVTIDQRGAGLDYWGVIAKVEGETFTFGSDTYTRGAFWYDYQRFDGGGDIAGSSLLTHGEAADAGGNVFFTYVSNWKIVLKTEYFQDGWNDLPPNTLDGFAPSEYIVSLVDKDRELIAPRIQAAYEASR